MKGIFITGTDTGVGKTVVTATLCRILRSRGIDAVALKPFSSGIGPDTDWRDNDPLLLSAAMDYAEPPEVVASVRLSQPLSPFDAARLTGATLDIDAVADATNAVAGRHEFALIEGVGGVRVPLTDTICVADFIKQLDIPALVVSRSAIGTINHSHLTVEALRQFGVPTEGLLFTRNAVGALTLDEKVGPETACRMTRVAFFGLVEYSRALRDAETPDEAANALPISDAALLAMADHLIATLV